jgi:class 3 adenylate cyclase/tetratricopeptide (TPR) repeat protein
MDCSACQTANPNGAKFCVECAAPLVSLCSKCGFDNPARAKFCSNCATPLIAKSTMAPSVSDTGSSVRTSGYATPPDGERRHVTVLFCDLVDSTAISAHLDPEQWHAVAAQYQRSAAGAIAKMGGHVAKYLGDGLVAYFGYPQAQEDAAERAVRAGLEILSSMQGLNVQFAQAYEINLSVRVGIHSGLVVVAQGGGSESDMFGDTPNIASRVQTVAPADTVVITSAVHELVSGLFVVEERGAHSLRGVEHPIQLYKVISSGLASGNRRGFSVREPTPFVGRDDETHMLMSRWRRVCEGEGQFMLMIGEPGIGKTRLTQEFRARIKSTPHLWIECAGAPFFASTPFHAVTQMLHQGLGWRGDETPEERAGLLEKALQSTSVRLDEALPLIAEMLNLPVPPQYPAPTLPPDQRRKRLLGALAGWVLSGRTQPLVIVMEDLHWVDPSTIELLQTLIEQGATSPLMLLCTARPEFRAHWPVRAHHVQITLNRLSARQTRELVTGVFSRMGLSKDVVEAVIDRTDGVPLFAEELTRLMIEGNGKTGIHEIPTTLLDSLAARLDGVGQAKEIAQLGAVLGREFSYELMRAISPLPDTELQSGLAKLADAELIFVRGMPPEATYQFKHALIQDAAYEALLKSKRRELHARIARTITDQFPRVAEKQPQVLARHWSEAGEADRAVSAWAKAAVAAQANHAFKEAEEAIRQALTMLSTLPETQERDARELELGESFVSVLRATKGVGSPEAINALARCLALAEKSGNVSQLVPALFGTWRSAWVAGKYRDATLLADQLLDLAMRERTEVNLSFAHFAQLITGYYRGDLIAAERHFAIWEQTWEVAGKDQRVTALSHAGLCARHRGHHDLARLRMAEANNYARNRQNPYEIATAQLYECLMHTILRDPEHAELTARQAASISNERGFQQIGALALPQLGWALARLGKAAEGNALIRDGLAKLEEIGSRVSITHFLILLAEVQGWDGAFEQALETIEQAWRANQEETVYAPYRLVCRGELRLAVGQTERAEADFREAIELARSMSAKAYELRATIALSRIVKARGDTEAAREILAPVYEWFVDGLDTVDMKDGRALLDELSYGSSSS